MAGTEIAVCHLRREHLKVALSLWNCSFYSLNILRVEGTRETLIPAHTGWKINSKGFQLWKLGNAMHHTKVISCLRLFLAFTFSVDCVAIGSELMCSKRRTNISSMHFKCICWLQQQAEMGFISLDVQMSNVVTLSSPCCHWTSGQENKLCLRHDLSILK